MDNLLCVVRVLRLHFRGQFLGCSWCFKAAVSATFVGCSWCFKTAVSENNLLGVVGVLSLQFPRTVCWV